MYILLIKNNFRNVFCSSVTFQMSDMINYQALKKNENLDWLKIVKKELENKHERKNSPEKNKTV